jgi:hypothetical protein
MEARFTGNDLASDLFTLELLVARRADMLARDGRFQGTLKLECWLMAEAEILRSAELLPPRFRSSHELKLRKGG